MKIFITQSQAQIRKTTMAITVTLATTMIILTSMFIVSNLKPSDVFGANRSTNQATNKVSITQHSTK